MYYILIEWFMVEPPPTSKESERETMTSLRQDRSGSESKYAVRVWMAFAALWLAACGPGGLSLSPSDVQTMETVLRIPGAVCSALDGAKVPGYVRVGCKVLTAVESASNPQGLDGTPAVAERRIDVQIWQVREDIAEEFLRVNEGP